MRRLRVPIERAFDHPIVRQVELSPCGVVQRGLLAVGHFAEMKTPILIEGDDDAACVGRDRKRRQDGEENCGEKRESHENAPDCTSTKYEVRNPKQIQNTKFKGSKRAGRRLGRRFGHSDFGFWICFGFRASYFGFFPVSCFVFRILPFPPLSLPRTILSGKRFAGPV